MPRRIWQIAAVILAVPAVLAGAAVFALWLTLPPGRAELRLAVLTAPVQVTLDGYGIPRIHAQTEADAAAALGYLHARDRMFQMELMRRAASGRLAEIAGPRAVKLDRMARIFGERLHAERSYATLAPNLRAILVSYTAGVNAWIAQRGRFAAPEDLVLGAPEPWTPVDCLLWSETVSLWLSDNYRSELSHAALAGRIPQARIDALWPPTADTPAPDAPAAPRQGPPMNPVVHGALEALPGFPGPFTLPDQASNAWAVDGRHTDTGAPIIAGDPHLMLGFPSLWYLARIETPGAVLVGATAPGVPFLVIGRNAQIGWSFTTTGIDTQDVFIEHVLPDGRYATPDGPRAFDIRHEVIHVRGAADLDLVVRSSRHGPVISEDGAPVLAVQMAQFNLGSPAPGLYALNRAASVAEAGRAAAVMTAPMQNLTVAGPDGIGLFTTGQVPLRRGEDTDVPKDGADGQHDWTGFAGGAALPHVVNPVGGVVENANQRTAPPDFPVALGRDFPAPLRARRIVELLGAAPRMPLGYLAGMQADDNSVLARDVLPALRAIPHRPGMAGQAQALLDGWNGGMDRDKPQGLIFNAAVQLFTARVLSANHVAESDIAHWAGFADWLLTPAGAGWCGGTCSTPLAQAFDDAMQDLARRYGDDPALWRWGTAHQAVFAHPLLGELPVVGGFASRRVAVDGDDTTLFRGGSGRLGDFEAHHGAAYRGVYSIADLERSRFIVTPGQSGNLMSRHAWDLLRPWADGQTVTLPAIPETVSATITLAP